MLQTTTPKAITNPIRSLAKKIITSPNLYYVAVKPEPWSIPSECFPNVEEKVKREGGRLQYGWQIWEWPNVMIEAEFHAVWISPSNEPVDITPKYNNESQILFLQDDVRKFDGSRIDNVRMALRKDKLINDFIDLAKAWYDILEKGNHADDPLKSTIDTQEAAPIVRRSQVVLKMLKGGCTEDSPCFCGSKRKYKNCCSLS